MAAVVDPLDLPSTAAGPRRPDSPLCILLADDATAFARVLSLLLGRGGHEVRRVERATAAIELLGRAQPVDLLILDLNLPDGPSLAVFRAARARPHPPAVCVISGSALRAMQTAIPGAELYVEKAYVPEHLEEILAAARDRRTAAG